MLGTRAGCCQGREQICEDLLGLGHDVAFANDLTRGCHRVLATDVDRADRTGYDNNVGERRAPHEAVGVDEFDASRCHALTSACTPQPRTVLTGLKSAPSGYLARLRPRLTGGSDAGHFRDGAFDDGRPRCRVDMEPEDVRPVVVADRVEDAAGGGHGSAGRGPR